MSDDEVYGEVVRLEDYQPKPEKPWPPAWAVYLAIGLFTALFWFVFAFGAWCLWKLVFG